MGEVIPRLGGRESGAGAAERRRVAVGAAKASICPKPASTKLAVDEIRRALFEVLLDHVGALFGQATGRNRCVELLPCRVDHRLNETVDGRSFFLRDVRERVSVAKLLVQLSLRQSEIGRCRLEPRERIRAWPSITKAVKAAEAAEEGRRLAGIDPLLQLRTLPLQ